MSLTPETRARLWLIISSIAGGFLLFSVLSKSAGMLCGIRPINVFDLALSTVQLLVTGLIFLQFRPPIISRILLGLFALFFIVSGFKCLNGVTSCGCFGDIETNPCLIAILDGMILGSISWTMPSFKSKQLPTARPSSSIALIVPLIAATVSTTGWWHMDTITVAHIRSGGSVSNGSVVNLEQVLVPGSSFDLLKNTNRQWPETKDGKWLVVFHREGCMECNKVLEMLNRTPNLTNILLLEVPSKAAHTKPLPTRLKNIPSAKLDPKKNWVVKTPFAVYLNSGKVVLSGSKDIIDTFLEFKDIQPPKPATRLPATR